MRLVGRRFAKHPGEAAVAPNLACTRPSVAHHATGRFALDLHPDDVYWCTADPGWVTGMSYGIISPLTHGVMSIVDEREFDARRWYQTLQDERVTVWYTSPTALRMLMKAGPEVAAEFDRRCRRAAASSWPPRRSQPVSPGNTRKVTDAMGFRRSLRDERPDSEPVAAIQHAAGGPDSRRGWQRVLGLCAVAVPAERVQDDDHDNSQDEVLGHCFGRGIGRGGVRE